MIDRDFWRKAARRACSARPCRGIWRPRPRFRLQRGDRRGARLCRLDRRHHPAFATSSPTISSPTARRSRSAHWLPRMVSGETATAIAMTEPGAGSDLQGISTTREARRQPLCRQRLQDLHHQRPACRPDHRRRQDRSERRRQGHLADPGRGRPRRLRPRPQPRQDRPPLAGHVRAVLRGRAGAASPTASARRAWASPI